MLPSLGIALPPSYPFPISNLLYPAILLSHVPALWSPFTFPLLWLLSIAAFSMCAVDPSPGSYACTIDVLLTEPSPWFRMLQTLKMYCVHPRCWPTDPALSQQEGREDSGLDRSGQSRKARKAWCLAAHSVWEEAFGFWLWAEG